MTTANRPRLAGQGIGTPLTRRLIAQAQCLDQDLALDVLSVNERARALYRRLGLREAGRSGENGGKIQMRSGDDRDGRTERGGP